MHRKVSIGGHNINSIRYADDTVLIADTQEKLHNILTVLTEASEERDLTINIDKTEVMVIIKKAQIPRSNVRINNKMIKQILLPGKLYYEGW